MSFSDISCQGHELVILVNFFLIKPKNEIFEVYSIFLNNLPIITDFSNSAWDNRARICNTDIVLKGHNHVPWKPISVQTEIFLSHGKKTGPANLMVQKKTHLLFVTSSLNISSSTWNYNIHKYASKKTIHFQNKNQIDTWGTFVKFVMLLLIRIKYNIHYPRSSSHFLLAQVTLAWNLSVPSKVYRYRLSP